MVGYLDDWLKRSRGVAEYLNSIGAVTSFLPVQRVKLMTNHLTALPFMLLFVELCSSSAVKCHLIEEHWH